MRQISRTAAEEVLNRHGLAQAWAVFNGPAGTKFEEITIQDIVGKLLRWGDITGPQIKFVGDLVAKINHREVIAAQRAAESAAAADCPTGRVNIEGEIIAKTLRDTPFGATWKIVVRHDSGYKVWGTLPSKLCGRYCNRGVEKGDRIRFTATVKHAPGDTKFGFYSRPTNAEVVTTALALQEVAA